MERFVLLLLKGLLIFWGSPFLDLLTTVIMNSVRLFQEHFTEFHVQIPEKREAKDTLVRAKMVRFWSAGTRKE